MFKDGTNVQTNAKYFERFGRVVIGITENKINDLNNQFATVRWIEQTGNIIPEHQNQLVLMMAEDLEII